jgi:hypothetical protein
MRSAVALLAAGLLAAAPPLPSHSGRLSAQVPVALEPYDVLHIEACAGWAKDGPRGRPISGQFTLRADGTVDLPGSGPLALVGCSLVEATRKVRDLISAQTGCRPETVRIVMFVAAWSNRVCYVVDHRHNGSHLAHYRFTMAEKETAAQALRRIPGLWETLKKEDEVKVESPDPVARALNTFGAWRPATHSLRSGDRIHIFPKDGGPKLLVQPGKTILPPIERLLGIPLLGHTGSGGALQKR